MRRRLIIFDSTLREGEQAPGCTMFMHEKVALARQLEKLQVDVVEAGFAAASQGDFCSVESVARVLERTVVSSLCRARESDIDSALAALADARKPRVHVVLGVSDSHLRYKLKLSGAQAVDTAVRSVAYARARCPDVQFTAEDAGRTDTGLLRELVTAVIDAGASTVNLSDTVGYRMPEEFAGIVRGLREGVRNLHLARLSVHIHDDLGVALASTLAAVEAGVEQVECTLNGLGDRAGICALEELVAAINRRQDYFPDIYTDIREEALFPACRAAARYTSSRIPPNKPVVGANVRKYGVMHG